MTVPVPESFLALKAIIFSLGCINAASALFGLRVELKLFSISTITSY